MSSKLPPYYETCAELYRRGNFNIQANTPWGVHEKQLETHKILNSKDITVIGYGGSARCFVAGTLVNTIKGHIPIELIAVGDMILSENIHGKLEYKKVLNTYKNSASRAIKFISFFINGCEIKSTHDHEYKFNGNYVKACDIAKIWSISEAYPPNNLYNQSAREINLFDIKRIEFTTENLATYDLCVEDNHNYVVSKENIKVHNSGKSWLAGEYVTMSCIAYPGTGWGLARRELKNLKRTTLITFFKVFAKYGLDYKIDYAYNQQDQIITFKNGSQIFLIDTAYQPQDPLYTRFGGYELTGLVIDESNETDYMAIEILSGRTGFRKNIEYNLPPRTLEMFNPDKGHVYNRFYVPYKDGREPEHQRFIKALPTDNPDPAVKVWIENQKLNASEITIQRLVNGNFEYDETKDRLIDHDSVMDYFTNEHVLPGPIKYITADIAGLGKDSTVIRVWAGLRVIERIEIFKSLTTETSAAIRALATKHGVSMSKTIVDESGLGMGCRDQLRCQGFIAGSKPIGITNYSNLKTQCTFLMAKLITERKVYEPCENKLLQIKIKQEMEWVRERDIDGDGKLKVISKDEVKQALRRSPDDWDSIYMRAWFELGSKI